MDDLFQLTVEHFHKNCTTVSLWLAETGRSANTEGNVYMSKRNLMVII